MNLQKIESSVTFDDLVGLENHRLWIDPLIPAIKKTDNMSPRGVLLSGMPGTGKASWMLATAKLLGRPVLRYHPDTRSTLPVLTHVLATLDSAGITLAVTDLDRWLETRMATAPGPYEPEAFLIPPDAVKAIKQADKNTDIKISCKGPSKRRELRIIMTCGDISVESRQPTLDVSEFPTRPDIDGEEIPIPSKTMESLATIAKCASNDVTRYVLNGIFFTPEDGGRPA